ncbi:MAG: AAA family ATPase [Anaerolineae bacterium]
MANLINPYQAGRPVANLRMLFGREGLALQLEQQLVAGQRVLLLYGPPLIGKTSLARHLPDMFTLNALPLYLSLGDAGSYTLKAVLHHAIRQLLDSLTARQLLSPNEVDTAADAVTALRGVLSAAHRNRAGGPVILLIDDLHCLAEAGLGLLAEFLEAIAVLQASDLPLQVMFTIDSRWENQLQHPLLDTAPAYHLGPLVLDDALKLITRPVEGVLRFDYGVTRRIAEVNSQHPFYLTLFGYTLFNRYAREGWVNLRYVDETLEHLLGLHVDPFETCWSEASEVERAVLSALGAKRGAHGPITRQEIVSLLATYDPAVKEEVIVQALDNLVAQRVLVRMGALSYRFYVELFRYWIDRHHKPAEAVQGIDWRRQAASPASAPELPRQRSPDDGGQAPARRPAWLTGLVGLALLGGLLLGGLLLGRSLGWISLPGAVDSPAVAQDPSQPATSVAFTTPTPAPTPTATVLPTPTPPVVVARTLPSIAYMARDAEGSWQIYVMNTDGSEQHPLSEAGLEDTAPIWSNDGNWLAFVSQRDGNREIYVMDVTGQNVHNVTRHPADDWTPTWSPDGSQLAFSSNRLGAWEIFILDATCITRAEGCASEDLVQLTNDGGGNITPVWSPDGQRLAFSSKRDGNWEVYSMKIDGTDLRRLTASEASDLAPVWSPSGELIAFETSRDGNVEVYVMSAVGGNPRNISNMPYADDHGPAWSPDGERLLFYSNREGNWDIFLSDLNGSQALNLTHTPDRDEQTPAWRP